MQHARATRLTNQSVFSLSSPMCRRNKGQSQLGTPQRRSHRAERTPGLVTPVESEVDFRNILMDIGRISTASIRIHAFHLDC